MPLKELDLDSLDFDEITSHNNFEKKDNNPLAIKELLVEMVTPDPKQPRKFFDEEKLQELSESIKEYGLLEPIVVIENEKGTYTILAGERRYRAHLLANLKTIKAIVTVSGEDDLEKQLIENEQRENLSIFEVAISYKILWDSKKYDTKSALAKRVSKKEVYVSKMFAVLTLDEEILNHLAINNPKIGLEVLTELAKIKDTKTQKEFYYQYIDGKITREDIRNRKKAVTIGNDGIIIHDGQTTIKDILEENEEAPVKTTEEQEIAEVKETPVKEVIKFDKKTKTILECHGFGTQNDLGTFISLHGDLEGAINIKEGRNKIEHSNNFNYKITIERIPVKK